MPLQPLELHTGLCGPKSYSYNLNDSNVSCAELKWFKSGLIYGQCSKRIIWSFCTVRWAFPFAERPFLSCVIEIVLVNFFFNSISHLTHSTCASWFMRCSLRWVLWESFIINLFFSSNIHVSKATDGTPYTRQFIIKGKTPIPVCSSKIKYPVLYSLGKSGSGHQSRLLPLLQCCMWIEFQSILTWLRGFSPGTPVSSLCKILV